MTLAESSKRRSALIAIALLGVAGCSSSVPRRPPGEPPTPASITRDDPGGDAADPVKAALERLASEYWGWRSDKFKTLKVRLADNKHWRRVRIWGYPTRAAFRYGDEHHAIAAVWYQDAEGDDRPEACMERFLAFAEEQAQAYAADYDVSQPAYVERTVAGEEGRVLVRMVEASVDSTFASNEYVGVVAAYPSFPGTCLIQGFAVESSEHPKLAREVRDRFVEEAIPWMRWYPEVESAPVREDR